MLKLARGALKQRLARGDSISGALRHINLALDLKGFTVFDSGDAGERHGGLSKTIQVASTYSNRRTNSVASSFSPRISTYHSRPRAYYGEAMPSNRAPS